MDIVALLSLAKYGCCEKLTRISSSKLASDLGLSQQTASRRIKGLEDEGYITREILPRGQLIRITTRGRELLIKMHTELSHVLEECEVPIYLVNGVLFSGMGEGRYYMERDGYKKQFKDKLGFEAYPGTLNLELKDREDIAVRQSLENLEGVEIKGFTRDNRTFGTVKCFKALTEGIESAVIIPSRSHYGLNTLEVIAPVNIRRSTNLKDGDIVSVKIMV